MKLIDDLSRLQIQNLDINEVRDILAAGIKVFYSTCFVLLKL
jgi:hypothetical protein